MAITTSDQLPCILKVDSNPLKQHVLSQLGYPIVNVELAEQQLEQVLRSTGDFVARYYPLERRFAYFNTIPLQSEYPVPDDAYWIQSVSWDPATTRIDEIFGAEAFLFSFVGGSILLTDKGPMQCEECYEKLENGDNIKLVSPFGNKKPRMRWNERQQPITVLQTEHDYVASTPNHPVSCNSKFKMAGKCNIEESLVNSRDKQNKIINKGLVQTSGTWSIQTSSGCFYISSKGEEFYLVH